MGGVNHCERGDDAVDEGAHVDTCMVRRSENGDLGTAWLQGHRLAEGSETLGLSSRVSKAASSLQMQPEEPVAASVAPPSAEH